MNKIKLLLIIFFSGLSFAALSTPPEVIAHRGFWRADGSAQNSIRSLIKADSIGCYASEFDVWMTADSLLVVNHDADINGFIIETSNSDVVLSQKLKNGENIPTLEEYLTVASKLPIRLVCEVKTHNSRSGEKEAIKRVVELIEKYGLESKTDYITFSKDGLKNFINISPKESGVYYLEGDYIPAQILNQGGKGIDYHLNILKKNPQWIDESHQLGLLVNVWTVDDPKDMEWCIDNGVDFITTNEPEVLQELIKVKNP